jgi:hypothetical protein
VVSASRAIACALQVFRVTIAPLPVLAVDMVPSRTP